jgi:ABC-type lipoprotein export system ATPase subunit
MEGLSIGHLAESRLYTLSGGERQRVAVGRAIVAGSPLILADEPTASLDRRSASLVTEALAKAAELGALVIVATHDADVAAACTHIHDLRTGAS